jgi:hypothetical protein
VFAHALIVPVAKLAKATVLTFTVVAHHMRVMMIAVRVPSLMFMPRATVWIDGDADTGVK